MHDGKIHDMHAMVFLTSKTLDEDISDETRIIALKAFSNGLNNMHKIGMVHGDLKVDNLLLHDDPKMSVVSDLGLSYFPFKKFSDTDPLEKRLNACRGYTFTYAACEIGLGKISYDSIKDIQARDVYSFGIVMMKSMIKNHFNGSDLSDQYLSGLAGTFMSFLKYQEEYGMSDSDSQMFKKFKEEKHNWLRKQYAAGAMCDVVNEMSKELKNTNDLLSQEIDLISKCLALNFKDRPTMKEIYDFYSQERK
jgi:serine/threonine protein kinase